jgi:hypothetical protein
MHTGGWRCCSLHLPVFLWLVAFCSFSSCACRAGITAASWHVDATFFASADASDTVVLWKKKAATAGGRRLMRAPPPVG